MRTTTRLIVTASLISLVACGGPESEDAADTPPAAADTGMASMPGMSGMMHDTAVMAQMANHMAMMQGISADSMRAMMPMHRQMAANMLANMNQQMREMNMAADAAWNALADSIRADLTRLPDLAGPELQTSMTEHHRRLTRLMDMHATMMKNMRL